MSRVVFLLAICVSLATGPLLGEDWGPLNAWKARRTVAVPPPDPKAPVLHGLDCCTVSFPTGEFLQPDGADLRVAVGGEPAPFKIVDIAFGGVVSLVAGIPRTAERMTVYYGNPAAKKLESNWEPQRGLWLETRRYKGGECSTLQGMREAWAKSDQRYGAGQVSQIFHSFNPFGPSEDCMCLYTGWLYIPKDATITFCVAANDIAYLIVEDKVVASKPTWGGMPHAQLMGDPIHLREGLHPVKMAYVKRGGGMSCSAGWWMPGMKRGEKYLHFQVIPDTAFAPIRYGRLVDYEVRGQAIGADFLAINDGDVLLDDTKLLVRFQFRDTSRPANQALQCQPLWEFGDGISTAARDPNHVYLSPGDYTATLTLRQAGNTFRAAQRVRVGPGYARAVRREWDSLENYYPILKDCQFGKMTTPDLITATRIFESLEKPEEIIATCSVLYQRADTLDDESLVRHCLLLGRYIREKEGKAEEALRVFTLAEQRTKSLEAKARLANEKGDVYYYFLKDYEKAEKEYTKTLTTYGKAQGTQVRLAQIRIGDLYRTKGDYDAALKAYERAADMPIGDTSEAVAAARRGSFPKAVEDYARRGLFKEAHEELDTWEWEFPSAKLEGFSTLHRARLALAEHKKTASEKPTEDRTAERIAKDAAVKKEEAIKQAEELLRVNKNSEFADDLLLFLTNVHIEGGELDKALATATRLLTDYPASELQEETRLKRVQIHLQQAKYDDAAKEALDLAKANEDSPNAPKALLLGATAFVRGKKSDDAIKALERLAQKYPTTEEATSGLKMLKELRPK